MNLFLLLLWLISGPQLIVICFCTIYSTFPLSTNTCLGDFPGGMIQSLVSEGSDSILGWGLVHCPLTVKMVEGVTKSSQADPFG